MKVKELKDILKNFEDDTEVVLSSDSEGNFCTTLYGFQHCLAYLSEHERDVEIFPIDSVEFDEYMEPVVVLYP